MPFFTFFLPFSYINLNSFISLLLPYINPHSLQYAYLPSIRLHFCYSIQLPSICLNQSITPSITLTLSKYITFLLLTQNTLTIHNNPILTPTNLNSAKYHQSNLNTNIISNYLKILLY